MDTAQPNPKAKSKWYDQEKRKRRAQSLKRIKASLGTLGLALVAAVIGLAARTLIVMWGWILFAVPVFDLPRLTLWQAFGLALVVSINYQVKK